MQVITIPVTAFAQNCRIIVCRKTAQAVIVDPGGDSDKIIAAVTKHDITVQAIWLTHGHLDHVGAAKQLQQHYQVKIIGPHKDEIFWFENLPMQAQMFGFAPISAFYPDQYLQHDEQLQLGELQFVVKHCPGHTPGHIVFYNDQHACVIVGDVIFNGSVGRTDFPQGDSAQLLTSIKQHILTLSDKTKIMPGHGPDTSVGHERRTNPFISHHFG